MVRAWSIRGLGLLSAVGLAACQPAPARPAPAPPTVIVARPQAQSIAETAEFTGRVAAVAKVEVRVQVSGRLIARSFQPRDRVRKGQELYRIRPASFEARAEEARGAVRRAEVRVTEAEETARRMEEALKTNAVSELEVIARRASRDVAEAELLSAKAALSLAEIDLAHTRVTAPIAGRISRGFVDVGNLVSGTERTHLATIVSDDDVFVYFNVDERAHLAYLRRHAEALKDPNRPRPKAWIKLVDEDDYRRVGEVEYGAPLVDAATGTVEVRARFKNGDGLLKDGLFCRVRVPLGPPAPRLLLPARAIRQDIGGHYVLTVNDEDLVERRAVRLGMSRGGEREIAEGLQPDDRVVIDGVQKARPGSKVAPREAAAAAATEGGKGS